MSRATVELDFFGIVEEKNSSNSNPHSRSFIRQRSFRDLQNAISKINPEVLKSVITSGSAPPHPPENGSHSNNSFSVPLTPKHKHSFPPVLPLYSTVSRPGFKNPPETAPLTIFYNGTVAVFDVHRDKAESILKLVEEGVSRTVESIDAKVSIASADNKQKQAIDGGLCLDDLPISRRKSLERFLEKRKERFSSVSPYSCMLDTRV